MLNRTFTSTAAALLISVSFVAKPVHASWVTELGYQLHSTWMANNNAWWNSLTPRQKYLAQGVSQIVSNNGGSLPLTQDVFVRVMQTLGAHPSEGEFVYNRIVANNNANQAIDEGNRVVDGINDEMACGFRPECYLR